MKTLHLKISIFIGIFLAFLGAISAQEEVDYASRFYEIRYSSTNYFSPSADSVEILNSYGDVFYQGKMYIDNYHLLDHDSLLQIKEEKGWVTYDAGGKIIKIEPYYNLIYSKEGLVGLADNTGKVLIPPLYDEIEYSPLNTHLNLSPSSVIAGKRKGDKIMKGIVSIDNKIILPFEYSYIYSHKHFTEVAKEVDTHKNGENDYYELSGFIDWHDNEKSAKILTNCIYDIYVPEEIRGEIVPYGNIISVKDPSTGLLGCINKYGKTIIPFKYSEICPNTYSHDEEYLVLWCKHSNNGSYDLFDAETGDRLFSDCEEWHFDTYYDKHKLWGKKNNVWYCIDSKTKKTLYSFTCEKIQWEHNIWCKKNNEWSCLDFETGKILFTLNNVDCILWDIKKGDKANYACILQDNRVGIIDASTGKVVVPCQYSYEKNVKFLIPIPYRGHQEYVIYVDKQIHTIYFIRLADGIIVKTLDKVSDIQNSLWMGDLWEITDMNKNKIICTASGQVIVGPEYQIKELFVGPDFIEAKSVGIFDHRGNLLLNLGEDCVNIEHYRSGDYTIPGLSVYFYNKMNGTRRCEYYYYNEGKFQRMESFNDLYRNYYAQCQEKFRKQPSDVDQNIPIVNKTNNNTHVFIIANENYYKTTDVPYALNDGRVFKEYCEKTLGVLPDNITMYENATLGMMRECVYKMKNRIRAFGKEANIIFYYAGHAISQPDESPYLFPVDGNSQLMSTAYSEKELFDVLGDTNVHSVTCLIDACYSGKASGRGLNVQRATGTLHGNLVVLSASSNNETAHQYPEKGHGIFTYYLLKKLQDTKGDVTLGDLADYIIDQVQKKSAIINDNMQTPTRFYSPAMELKWRRMKFQ